MAASVVIYIHGFNSSPQSRKAQQTQRWVASQGLDVEVVVPQLPYAATDAIAILEAMLSLVAKGRPVGLIGSSLGGYYATYLAEHWGLPAALVNPAVRPYDLLADYLGENTNIYTGERYELTPAHVTELRALDVPEIRHPQRFFLAVQSADMTLDYRQAVAKFSRSRAWIEAGGSHEFDGFERLLPGIFSFFKEQAPPGRK